MFKSTSNRVLVVLTLLSLSAVYSLAGTPYVLPQLAFGGGWSTTVYLQNTSTIASASTAYFYDANGNPMAAPANGGPLATQWQHTVGSGAAVSIEFPNSGPLQQGWISLDLAAGVTGYAVFRQSVEGAQDQEAVVPLAAPGFSAASFAFDNRQLVTTAALVNPSSVSASVNITVRNAAATVLGSTQITLGPRAKTAFVLSELAGLSAAASASGTVDFVTASPATVSVLGLRFRGLAFTSIPAYHGPISTSQAPASIPAPVLQGSALTSSSARLTWISTAPNPIRFRIEWRGPGGAYTEVTQPSAASLTTDLAGLSAATTHAFRMRVETTSGLSPYSNEVLISTPAQAAIAPPSGLRLVSANQVEATLAWVNNAPGANAVRLEVKNPGTTGFIDLGASSLTGTKVTGLAAQQTYTFRARAQTAEGYSTYSSELVVTTPPRINVFLLHGIRQDWTDMTELRTSLSQVLSSGRFDLSGTFSFAECSMSGCSTSCSISLGGQRLGQLVAGTPTGQVVFVGYSMGGLIARDLIANNWNGAMTGKHVAALVTLGTPNLGYPYASFLDRLAVCDPIAQQMEGDFRAEPNKVILSQYLLGLYSTWRGRGFPGTSSTWLAAAGQACADPWRSFTTPSGCSDAWPRNDRVVCSQSATYGVDSPVGTTPTTWTDPESRYVHTLQGWFGNVFCDFGSDPIRDLSLGNPPPGGLLVTRIAEVLNALP